MRVAVLISGGGTNLQALIQRAECPDPPLRIVQVLSNRPDALGLERARRHGIPQAAIDHRRFADRAAFEAAIEGALAPYEVDLLCLAGFMRVLTSGFVERWHNRLVNIHPSLLPAFPGMDTHARVLAAGAQVSGCTVHLVRAAVDTGPILVQGVVPVLPGDDPARLAARVLEVEHLAYPRALTMLARGELTVRGDEVIARDGDAAAARLVCHPALLRCAAG